MLNVNLNSVVLPDTVKIVPKIRGKKEEMVLEKITLQMETRCYHYHFH